jgi:hypothetical protein
MINPPHQARLGPPMNTHDTGVGADTRGHHKNSACTTPGPGPPPNTSP